MSGKQPIAAIYCRVSTDGQGDNASLPTQEQSCREYAAKHGYAVDERFLFKERHSGLEYHDRPKIRALMQAVEARAVDVIIAHDDDRLSRDPVHRLRILDDAKYYGITVHYALSGEADTSRRGQLMTFIDGDGDREEVARIRERTMRGTRDRLASGKLAGTGVCAYGYQWGDTNPLGTRRDKKTHYIENPLTAPTVRRMFAWSAAGVSIRGIVQRLYDEKIPTPRGKPRWNMSTVREILRNPVYTGQASFGRTAWRKDFGVTERTKSKRVKRGMERPEGPHTLLPDGLIPRLVSDKQFAAVQERMATNKANATRNTTHPELFLLRGGFIRCGYCGYAVGVRYEKPERKRPSLYAMGGAASHAHCGHRFSTHAAKLDEDVWGLVKDMFSDPVILQHKILDTVNGPDPTADERADLKAELAEIEQEQATLALNMGRVTAASAVTALAKRLDALGTQHAARSERLAALMTEYDQWRAAQDEAASLKEWWQRTAEELDSLDYDAKRERLRRMGARVRLWGRGHEPPWELVLTIALGGEEFTSTFTPLTTAPNFVDLASLEYSRLGGQGRNADRPDDDGDDHYAWPAGGDEGTGTGPHGGDGAIVITSARDSRPPEW